MLSSMMRETKGEFRKFINVLSDAGLRCAAKAPDVVDKRASCCL